MWENIQTYQENGFLNNNPDDAEDLAERYKLNDSDVVNVPLIQQRHDYKNSLGVIVTLKKASILKY